MRSDAADVLDGMTWQQFEQLVGEGFRLQGYRVLENGGGGADGGVDLVLTKDGEKYLVQCKQMGKPALSYVLQADGTPPGKARRECGSGVLGMHRLPELPRHTTR